MIGGGVIDRDYALWTVVVTHMRHKELHESLQCDNSACTADNQFEP